MTSVCIYFEVHQPRRVKPYRFFDIGEDPHYFNDEGETKTNNRRIMRKVAEKCYLPANALMLEILKRHSEFRITFSLSGIFLEQCEEYAPDVLDSFKRLAETGQVEFLAETYYHSLAFLHSLKEFREQITLHQHALKRHFGAEPRVFRNTELIYRNDIADEIARLGFHGMLAEGADHILGWRSPAFLYHAKNNPRFKVLLKNYRLSDDIAFRFGERSWAEYPLTADKFSGWVNAHHGAGDSVNLFMDYETLGEHQWVDTGIFDFWRALPGELMRHSDTWFATPSDIIENFKSVGVFDAPDYVSWADVERDISAWLGNELQHDALRALYALEEPVKKTKDPALLGAWRRLTTSDHFYYMCTKWWNDGDVHAYFNPYQSPYDAYLSYMNALSDLVLRASAPVDKKGVARVRSMVKCVQQFLSKHNASLLCHVQKKLGM